MRAILLLSTLALLSASCGGGIAELEVNVTPFTAEHELLFENGLDMVRDPEALGGNWFTTWERELDARITHADVVALVTVRAVRTDTDLERRDTFRLVNRVDRTYLGDLDEEVTLSVAESEAGYGTVETNERRLLDAQFIAFIKWQDGESGVRSRWHMSPATEAVAIRVRDLLRTRRDVRLNDGTRRRVIIRQN